MSTIPQMGGAAQSKTLAPVVIEVRGSHAYKNRGKGKSGCGFVLPDNSLCMKAMTWGPHLSLPLSLNTVGSRGGHFTYKSFKGAWEEVLQDQLAVSGLPRGWAVETEERINNITVECRLCFPKMPTVGRDQGNFRWFLEKCLGDALVKGGYLEDDSIWPTRRYEFYGLEMEHRPGEAWTQLMLFPS